MAKKKKITAEYCKNLASTYENMSKVERVLVDQELDEKETNCIYTTCFYSDLVKDTIEDVLNRVELCSKNNTPYVSRARLKLKYVRQLRDLGFQYYVVGDVWKTGYSGTIYEASTSYLIVPNNDVYKKYHYYKDITSDEDYTNFDSGKYRDEIAKLQAETDRKKEEVKEQLKKELKSKVLEKINNEHLEINLTDEEHSLVKELKKVFCSKDTMIFLSLIVGIIIGLLF